MSDGKEPHQRGAGRATSTFESERSQKLNTAGAAAIPVVTSSTPPPPAPPSGAKAKTGS